VLEVLERLEVGPIRVEPDRLVCPYTVFPKKGEPEELSLSYRYEEPVFDPKDPASVNLAAMIAAQVALNYGLFASEIVFHGPFDRHDRRFLDVKMENTSREILVLKLLEPNPFLTGTARELPALPRDRYTRATLRFPDAEEGDALSRSAAWGEDPRKVVVLSSGGKDSLLSLGLLREIGAEAHSIFLNESGRHWLTALRAYRVLHEQDPLVTRVWTSSDRVFNAMLRHLPFIRPDFQTLRSDEYPIRLWTVAVFLFGALPLLKKRGIGRLVIGDEYDTSVRGSHQGIQNYRGLFDQSIWFDHALSRYFQHKGWNVAQFSVLRPLSEMLIEKVLAARYPELLRLQLSCHAAHTEGDTVLPCGRCEKCRRIVGMLSALGVDPGLLGYTKEQIARSLRELGEKGVHQESAGARHMAYLLRERGVLPAETPGLPEARAVPEVVQLRFHPERSPLHAVPDDFREPLLRILLQHADGAVERSGRVWLPIDPLHHPSLHHPYPFQAASARKGETPVTRESRTAAQGDGSDAHRPTTRSDFLLAEMTWPEAEQRLKKVDVALLPVGSIEQHGPHLPLDTDAFDADYLCREVARACRPPRPLVLPLISYGVSYHHDSFKGTVSVSPETLSRLVHEIGMNVARQGITKLVIVNGHGGNSPALHFAAQMINRDAHIFTCVDTGESSDTDVEAMSETPNDVHAGEIETSTTLAVRPELVETDKIRRHVPRFSSRYLDFTSKRSVGWYVRTEKISPTGVLGDPTKADAEKGRKMWDVMIRNLVELVEGIKDLSLDQIYQRRY